MTMMETKQIIPLTVLIYEGPMARAYLSLLKSKGFYPEKIIVLVQKRDVASKKLIAPWLPTTIGKKYAEKIQDIRMNYWPRKLAKTYSETVSYMQQQISESLFIPHLIYDSLTEPAHYQQYAEKVEKVFVDGFKDPALKNFLEEQPKSTLLFTGGGIVPKHLLEIPHIKFIHVHPGYLPYVRGADGLLWSTLLRGYPSATCFYLAPGIDTGDIIKVKHFPHITFSVKQESLSDTFLYRMIYSYYDPLIRASLLVDLLEENPTLSELPGHSQLLDEGVTYRFMDKETLHRALSKLFIKSSLDGA